MPWFKVDDKMHSHRKTRKALRSHPTKRRDASVIGVWALAGSWSSDNLTDGFVPADELEGWDDDAPAIAARLVAAGLWHEDTVEDEAGYRFNDWTILNPDAASVLARREAEGEGGRFGNHVRWHTKKGVVVPDCSFCTADDPSGTRSGPRSGRGRGTRVGGESSRPGPSRPDAAAAAVGRNAAAAPVDNHPVGSIDLPPAVEILKAGLEAHKLVVRWDRLDTDQLAQIDALIATHGDGPLIRAAIATHRPNAPAAFAQAWLGAWSSLPAPGTKLRVVADEACTAPGHVGTVRHCAQCAGEQKAAR